MHWQRPLRAGSFRRGIVFLGVALMVLGVLALSLCLIPSGHGPYSAVHGPTSRGDMRAYLQFLWLLLAAVMTVLMRSAGAINFPSSFCTIKFAEARPGSPDLFVLTCSRTC